MFIVSWLILLLIIVQVQFGGNNIIIKAQDWLANITKANLTHSQSFEAATYQPTPQRKTGVSNPNIEAKAALIYDVGSGQYLYKKNDQAQLPMASVTKLMTALVIMQRHKPDEIVTIPNDLPGLGPADEALGFQPGEKFTVAQMLQALLIQSANDAANALATWDAGSIENFTAKMNDYAREWGLQNSHFESANGLDTPNHYSSAQDLQKLSSILLNSKVFRQVVNTQKTSITSEQGKTYQLTTINQDLNLSYVYGIKTGFTDNAGQCLVLLGRKDGHELITVVLNSPDRFQESKNMLDWAFNNYAWK
jgi:D-alanyl-D-alanine carboxypeptidase